VQDLCGYLNCQISIGIFYGNLPDEIVEHLKENILLKFNGGEVSKVIPDDMVITLKPDKWNHFLFFEI